MKQRFPASLTWWCGPPVRRGGNSSMSTILRMPHSFDEDIPATNWSTSAPARTSPSPNSPAWLPRYSCGISFDTRGPTVRRANCSTSAALPSWARAHALRLRMGPSWPIRRSWKRTINRQFREADLVFRAVQDTRHHGVADELSDWRSSARRDPVGNAIWISGKRLSDFFHRASRDMRLFSAR